MNGFLDHSTWIHALADSPWWVTALCKTTVVLILAWTLHFLLRTQHPRWQVILWRTAIAGVLVVASLDALRLVSLSVEFSLPARTSAVVPGSVNDATLPRLTPNSKSSPVQPRSSLSKFTPDSISALAAAEIVPTAKTPSFHPSTRSFQWTHTTLATIWIGGVFCLILRWLLSKWRLRNIVAGSRLAADWIERECARICAEMRIQPCRIVEVDLVGSPCLGWNAGRPVLLIPSAIVASTNPDEMTAILTHELSHLRSHDLPWTWGVNAVTGLLWPHPLCWAAGSAHRRACEDVADAESVRLLGQTELYSRTLAKVALSVTTQQRPVGVAMTRVSDVRRRLDRVKNTFGLHPLSRRQIAASIGLAATVFLLLGTLRIVDAAPPTEEQPKQAVANSPRLVIVSVRGSDGELIKGATLQASNVAGQKNTSESLTLESLGEGEYRVAIPNATRSFALEASAPHHVPSIAVWRGGELTKELTDAFNFRLAKGTEISGRVIDENGNPIEGATVFVLDNSGTRDRGRPRDAVFGYPVKTGMNGLWVCDVVPKNASKILLKLTHPDYVSDSMYSETANHIPVSQLRSGTHQMLMKKGVTVTGRVLDSEGEPVPEATVYQGSDRFGSGFPQTSTDANGEFTFEHCKLGKMVLTVVAKNLAPELNVVQVVPEMDRVLFQLAPGKTLRLRALDQDGEPLPDIYVRADTWRGHRSLADAEIPRDTDEEGVYVWNNAPSDGVEFDILAEGFLDKRNYKLTARDEEYIVKFIRPLTVTGTVVNAKTKQQIEAFDVIQGFTWKQDENDGISWEHEERMLGKAGAYESRFDYPYPGHLLRIEATGYEPAVSRVFQSDEGIVTLDFELNPVAPLRGIVTTGNGQPAANVQVVLATTDQRVVVEGGRLTDMDRQTVAISDAEGRFQLPSQTDAFKLFFLNDFGAAIIPGYKFQSGQTVELKPWVTISGTVVIGTEPAAQTGVVLYEMDLPYDQPKVYITYQTGTDSQGHFSFSRVFPNVVFSVQRVISTDAGNGGPTHGQTVMTEPGQDFEVKIGGTGRPIVGHVNTPEKDAKYGWGITAILPDEENYPFPEGVDEMSPLQQQTWSDEWKRTAEGMAFIEKSSKWYAVVIDEEGGFRVEDIPSGEYLLSLEMIALATTDQWQKFESLGRLTHEFTVPEMAGGRSDQPLDLGDLTLDLP